MDPITETVRLAQPDTPVSGTETLGVLAQMEPWMMFAIVMGTLLALMVSLWLVYNYIARIRTTSMHRQMLFDAVYEARLREIREQTGYDLWASDSGWVSASEELEDSRNEMLIQRDALIHDIEQLDQLVEPTEQDRRYREDLSRQLERVRTRLNTDLSEEKIEALKVEEKQLREKSELEAKAQEETIRRQAAQDARVLVPPSLTVAGMGITGTFFIELTAILTIIFGIIILGIIGVLGTQEISPILAAIAGYVLGKTTAGSKESEVKTTGPSKSSSGGEARTA